MDMILSYMKNKYLNIINEENNKPKTDRDNDLHKSERPLKKSRQKTKNYTIKIDTVNNYNDIEPIKLKKRAKNKKNSKTLSKDKNLQNNLKFSTMYQKLTESSKTRKQLYLNIPDYKQLYKGFETDRLRFMLLSEKYYPLSLSSNEYLANNLLINSYLKKEKLKKIKKEIITNDKFRLISPLNYKMDLFLLEKLSYTKVNLYQEEINNLLNKIYINQNNEMESILTKEFDKRLISNNKNVKIKFESYSLIVTSLNNNDKKIINLPISILPFILAINRNMFNYYISSILTLNDNEKINTLDNLDIEKNDIAKYINEIVNECKDNLYDKNSILFENNINNDFKYNIFINDINYIIEFCDPFIELSKNDGQIIIRKNLGKGILLSLVKNDFQNWENLCLKYLNSFKKFRYFNFLNSSYEKNKQYILNLDIKKINYNNNLVSMCNTNIEFFSTYNIKDKIKFCYLIFNTYNIEIKFYGVWKKFRLNLEECKKLINLSQKYDILNILYKCTIENYSTHEINLNFKILDDLNINSLSEFFIKNHKDYNMEKEYAVLKNEYDSLEYLDNYIKGNDNVHKNELFIYYKNPCLIFIEDIKDIKNFENIYNSNTIFYINNKYKIKLGTNNINNWIYILKEYFFNIKKDDNEIKKNNTQEHLNYYFQSSKHAKVEDVHSPKKSSFSLNKKSSGKGNKKFFKVHSLFSISDKNKTAERKFTNLG